MEAWSIGLIILLIVIFIAFIIIVIWSNRSPGAPRTLQQAYYRNFEENLNNP